MTDNKLTPHQSPNQTAQPALLSSMSGKCLTLLSIIVCHTLVVTSVALEPPEPAQIAGWQPLQAGEHPRLLFRAADLPKIRQRAQTPAGQAMIARLKYLLGGGEAMPSVFNENAPVNKGPVGPRELPCRCFHRIACCRIWSVIPDNWRATICRSSPTVS